MFVVAYSGAPNLSRVPLAELGSKVGQFSPTPETETSMRGSWKLENQKPI